MYVARILFPVKVLGPGMRVGIWLAGCGHACRGCSNPELWEPDPKYRTTRQTVLQLIADIGRQHRIEGFTITGGEPFEQAEELAGLLEEIRDFSEDVLIYSGYLLEELREKKQSSVEDVIRRTAVLIDGRYVEEKNENCSLRGSSNQRIHILKEDYREKYDVYLNGHRNEIQNFMSADGVISVGIHRAGFQAELGDHIKFKGLEESK